MAGTRISETLVPSGMTLKSHADSLCVKLSGTLQVAVSRRPSVGPAVGRYSLNSCVILAVIGGLNSRYVYHAASPATVRKAIRTAMIKTRQGNCRVWAGGVS